MTAPALIGLDWGTTSFRAYLMAADGSVLERRHADAGILQVPDGRFEDVLAREAGPWLHAAPGLPVIASGMVTSRQGWIEVPYLPCPAGAAELAGALFRHELGEGRAIHFVPGLLGEDESGVPDVIRGEETQIAGLAADAPPSFLAILPGTHSKWALVEGGRIVRFQTFMTGEVFAVLRAHSILGRMIEQDAPHDPASFAQGLAHAGAGGQGLLRRLFSARTLALTDRLPTTGVASYLSGLLIGTEVAEGLALIARDPGQAILVVGQGELAGRYLEALERAGRGARSAPEDAAAAGHFAIARAAGLLP